MRLSYVLLVVIAVLAAGNALPIETEATRSLRSHQTVDEDDAAEEERGGFTYKFDFNVWDDLFHGLPEQFQRMRTEPETLRNILASWKTGMGLPSEAVAFMKHEGLSEKAIMQFKSAFEAYLKHTS
ncbi:Secreted RxLR effector peptide protein [Phytophthora palmivora]|uniref:RxLR effector protein n=1 Tax=Phytophthora palmivora TaxID=4796 RepID=A0A2P4Y5G7_9STRA|nr:Secreted RxLR effector peptide protein [Phytophthora palmivora]